MVAGGSLERRNSVSCSVTKVRLISPRSTGASRYSRVWSKKLTSARWFSYDSRAHPWLRAAVESLVSSSNPSNREDGLENPPRIREVFPPVFTGPVIEDAGRSTSWPFK